MTSRDRARVAIVSSLSALLLVGFLALMLPALANHANGTYAGTVVGGGTVQFTVQGDMITDFQATNIPCDVGGQGSGSLQNLAISGSPHSFGGSDADLTVNGAFNQSDRAAGTLRVLTGTPDCNMNNESWEANRQPEATPTPTPSPTPQPCRCEDVTTRTRKENAFSHNRDGSRTSWILVTKSIDCEGNVGRCEAELDVILKSNWVVMPFPKKDMNFKCKKDTCVDFEKTVDYAFRVPANQLPAKGETRTVRFKYKIKCNGKTIEYNQFIVINHLGRVQPADSRFDRNRSVS